MLEGPTKHTPNTQALINYAPNECEVQCWAKETKMIPRSLGMLGVLTANDDSRPNNSSAKPEARTPWKEPRPE